MTTVLVVDDSRFMRTVIGKSLEEYGYTVETARNGKEAVDKVTELDPDVVTMDVQMPEMDGIEAVEHIMRDHPVPILMLSAHTQEGADTTLEALQKGAVDFLPKPDGDEQPINTADMADGLVKSVEAVSGTDVNTVAPGDTATPDQAGQTAVPEPVASDAAPTVVIGASTGGPRLVENIITDLPSNLNARVFIVQHMPGGFTARFADRLDGVSEYTVKEAADGMTVTPGTAVVAKGDEHLVADTDNGHEMTITTTDPDPDDVTPSIDVTLESIAETTGNPLVAVLLTGMGDDGSVGVAHIKDAGGRVIAQDEETSPVFGIPRRAINTGHVDTVLPDREIVSGIIETATELQHEGDEP